MRPTDYHGSRCRALNARKGTWSRTPSRRSISLRIAKPIFLNRKTPPVRPSASRAIQRPTLFCAMKNSGIKLLSTSESGPPGKFSDSAAEYGLLLSKRKFSLPRLHECAGRRLGGPKGQKVRRLAFHCELHVPAEVRVAGVGSIALCISLRHRAASRRERRIVVAASLACFARRSTHQSHALNVAKTVGTGFASGRRWNG